MNEQDIAEALTRVQAHAQAQAAGRAVVVPIAKAAEGHGQESDRTRRVEFRHSFSTESERG